MEDVLGDQEIQDGKKEEKTKWDKRQGNLLQKIGRMTLLKSPNEMFIDNQWG